MKFLLTSAGIKNTSIHNALVNLLGKPIAESARWYPHRDLRPPQRTCPGMAVHQWTRTHLPHVRARLEVCRKMGRRHAGAGVRD